MCIWYTGPAGQVGRRGVKGFRGPIGSTGATGVQVINGRVKRQAGCPGKLQYRVNIKSNPYDFC